jgi:HPt (histidine-containing phosphotransfer) domain-containing protein
MRRMISVKMEEGYPMTVCGESLRPRSLMSISDSPIDLDELLKLGDAKAGPDAESFVHEVIELFMTSAPQLYSTARTAFADGDPQSVARAAHKLKSQAAYFSATRVVEVCRSLEQFGYRDELARCEVLLDDLEDELDRVMVALQPHRGRRQTA